MNDNTYEKLATKIGTLVDSKNKQYGDSFAQSGEFLKLIYPNGIPADAYTDALCIVRIFDKLKRIGNASNLPVNEGKIDAWSDIIGYGLLGLQKDSEPVESGLGHAEMLARRQAAAKEQHEKNVRLVEAGKAVADDIKKRAARACFDEEPAEPKRQGVMGLISAEELSDERKKNLSPERLAEENLALARLAIEEVKAKSGFEDFMKDIAEADEPRRAQVRANWDKLETDLDSKKKIFLQKEVQSNILKEIEKAKEQHDSIVSCAICNKPFDMPLSKEVLDTGNAVVHESCYRERFANSPE